MSASSEAKPSILGAYPRTFEEKSRNHYNMWKPAFPDCYYNNSLLTNSNGQLTRTPYPQQQQQQSYMQNYSYVPSMQQTLPHYGAHENQNFTGLNRAPMPIQNPTHAQQQHAWLAYQAQHLKQQQSYSYWYGLNQQMAGRTYHQSDALKQQPTINLLERPTRSGRSQPLPSYSNNARLPGCAPDFYSPLSSGGSLNRIDSISSFTNPHGLRIRSSEDEMNTYQRIAARRLKLTANNSLSPNPEIEQQAAPIEEGLNEQPNDEVKPPQESKQIQPTNSASKVSLQSKGNSLFRKLGLIKQRKSKSVDLSNSNSNSTQECSTTSSQKSRKKPNFLKRIFGGMHYPSTVQETALKKKDQQEAIKFEKMLPKHLDNQNKAHK